MLTASSDNPNASAVGTMTHIRLRTSACQIARRSTSPSSGLAANETGAGGAAGGGATTGAATALTFALPQDGSLPIQSRENEKRIEHSPPGRYCTDAKAELLPTDYNLLRLLPG